MISCTNESLVKNAADEQQVAKAAEKEKIGEELAIDDLRRILSTDYGRRFLWRLLIKASVFESIWRPSAEIHHLAGKQDFGHFIMAKIIEANSEAYFTMMRESIISQNNKEKPYGRKN